MAVQGAIPGLASLYQRDSAGSRIGFLVGALSAILGVGGGFVIVPAMIYILRMPTNVVTGTSLVQIIFVTAATTVLQAINNHAVDAVLALLLVIGGVVGAQFGVRLSSRMRGEQLRLIWR